MIVGNHDFSRSALVGDLLTRFGEQVVDVFNKPELLDAGLDPCGEVAQNNHEGVQRAGIAELNGLGIDGSGENGNESEIGIFHDELLAWSYLNELPPTAKKAVAQSGIGGPGPRGALTGEPFGSPAWATINWMRQGIKKAANLAGCGFVPRDHRAAKPVSFQTGRSVPENRRCEFQP